MLCCPVNFREKAVWKIAGIFGLKALYVINDGNEIVSGMFGIFGEKLYFASRAHGFEVAAIVAKRAFFKLMNRFRQSWVGKMACTDKHLDAFFTFTVVGSNPVICNYWRLKSVIKKC